MRILITTISVYCKNIRTLFFTRFRLQQTNLNKKIKQTKNHWVKQNFIKQQKWYKIFTIFTNRIRFSTKIVLKFRTGPFVKCHIDSLLNTSES